MKKLFILICICVLSFLKGLSQQQPLNTDSLKIELSKSQTDTSRIHTLLFLASEYYSTKSKPDSALSYFEEALSISRRIKSTSWEIRCLLAIGYMYRSTGLALKAGEAWQKALGLSEKINDSISIAQSLDAYGYIYFKQGEIEKELQVYKREELIARKIKNSSMLRRALSQEGTAYQNLGEDDSSEAVLREALKMDTGNYFIFSRLAGIKSTKGQIDSAIYYSKLAINKLTYNNLRNIYLMENYDRLANLSLHKNQIDSAFKYAEKSYEIALNSLDSSNIITPSHILATLYERKGNYKEAFRFLEISNRWKSLTDMQDERKQLSNLTFQEQQQKQEIEIAKNRYKDQIKFYIVLSATGIFLLLAVLLYRNNRNKQKTNTLLTRQKEKIETTLNELKSTQSLLIQSEKMASLGELTAGIAHEIQNPLNFVNNFSEVNKEMLEELKTERLKPNAERDDDLQDDLINDVMANEEKINHHGKRADAIVKGMLQHSRSSTGVKEPTDINALADEYLRLSYHGLRAKDKSFNATMKTDFDETIGKINIIPQDIGRVLLNLYNNAFYAVGERRKEKGIGYEPTVSVSTKKMNDKVILTVMDNGNGIPKKVIDKIFQPFFTTKPTGQGTGLGLSLSYDIIKAHGGEIKVNTKENEGSEFIIELPLK